MTDEQIQVIHAALEELDRAKALMNIDQREDHIYRIALIKVKDNAPDWLRALLTEAERYKSALQHIVTYGADGEADGTSYAADTDAMRAIARAALEDGTP